MRRGNKFNRLADFWLGIPILNALATIRQKQRWPGGGVNRIGVMCSPALGDTLLFSAVAQDLRAHFDGQGKDVKIIHFCMKQNLAAAELVPGVDQRVLIELTKPRETVKKMRAEHLDVLLDFTSWQRLTAFYSLAAGARFTAGFETAGQYRGRGYDLAIEHRKDRHEVENFRAILQALGIASTREPKVDVPEVLKESTMETGEIVVFHPWASGQNSLLREWPVERWVECAKKIGSPSTTFVVTGGPADMERSESFVARFLEEGLEARSFVSPDGFVSLSHLLRRARVVVSVNTGVMHLAAILGAPTVSLNGPTAPQRWGPYGKCVAGVEPADGSGGYLNLGFEFPHNPEDVMKKILVDDVVRAVEHVVAACDRTDTLKYPSKTNSNAMGGVLWRG